MGWVVGGGEDHRALLTTPVPFVFVACFVAMVMFLVPRSGLFLTLPVLFVVLLTAS
jgi:hypothetical protein